MPQLYRQTIGWLLICAGLITGGIHLYDGFEELAEGPLAVLSGAVLPLFVSVGIAAFGYHVTHRKQSNTPLQPLLVWSGTGLLSGIAITILFTVNQAAEGGAVTDPWQTVAMFGTFGLGAGLLLGHHDCQRRKHLNQEKQQTKRLENVVSIISHDLRNPLNVAAGHLDLAREDCNIVYLDAIERSHTRMETLLEDALTLARDATPVSNVEEVDLDAIVKSCWDFVDTADATLTIDTTPTVWADRTKLQSIFENLFRNAVEHAGPGVTIRVGGLPDGFYVEDDGPGIPRRDRDAIFDPGYTTDDRGTGLGLHIVAQLAAAHDWTVTVTDGTHGGARFEFHNIDTAADRSEERPSPHEF